MKARQEVPERLAAEANAQLVNNNEGEEGDNKSKDGAGLEQQQQQNHQGGRK